VTAGTQGNVPRSEDLAGIDPDELGAITGLTPPH
jgi:hypothetical protein